jgi:hypothetical protein
MLIMLSLLLGSDPSAAQVITLDDFEDLSGWQTITSEGAHLEIAQDTGHAGKAMRLDFDFKNHGIGFVVVRKAFSVALPDNYEFRFYLRAEAPQNDLQFKLVDAAGNVWWVNRHRYDFSKKWQPIVIKKRHLQFAWGPAGGGIPKDLVAVEFALATGKDGRGSVWIDELSFAALEAPREYTLTPMARASTATHGHEPEWVLDQDSLTSWHSGSLAEDQWLSIDFLKNREYGGLVIDWDPEDYATAYQVQVSDDGENWRLASSLSAAKGGRNYIYMPDAESRYLRLALQKSSRGRGYGIRTIAVQPLEFSSSPNHFFTAIASDAPRGIYPKYFYSEQSYWTVIGVSGDDKEGLLNEEGMLEVDQGSFSIEPFLYKDQKLITWNSVELAQELEKGYLPIPSVIWKSAQWRLRITAYATGEAGASTLYARYRLENTTADYQPISLFLAIRPFQVNPPWQNLNNGGGASHIHEISSEGRTFWINQQKRLTALTRPDGFGAIAFAQGAITDYLSANTLPLQTQVSDPFGYASGALAYHLNLPPGSAQEIYLAIPFQPGQAGVNSHLTDEEANAIGRKHLDQAIRVWEDKLNRVELQLPAAAEEIVNTLKSTLAYILINRDGPAIQPGSRTYSRSWIRDGALTSAALLSMGHTEEVREFIQWFAQHQFPSGKVPCCVDQRGADPTPENDSHGEFIFLVMEYYRYTRDVGFLIELWPHIVKAVEYLDWLRQQRLTDLYQNDAEKQAYYGLLPESISHEGYAAAPQHSYWDDFFTLRGLKDATQMAIILSEDGQAAAFAALRDTFRRDLYASLNQTIAKRGIRYIPGCVELADFDPTATAIAIDPGGELPNLPEPALTQTFAEYYEHFRRRRDGLATWDNYTPYELRTVGTMIHLGQKTRAHEILNFFLADQRPAAWNQWAEVVWHDPKTPRFLGDMPHTWVGSDFIRSVRSLFAFEREADQALVIAAGLPSDWVQSTNGITLKRLPTHYGTLNYTLRFLRPDTLYLRLSGDLTLPAGKVVFRSPLDRPLQRVTINGKDTDRFTATCVVIGEFPAEVVLRYGS